MSIYKGAYIAHRRCGLNTYCIENEKRKGKIICIFTLMKSKDICTIVAFLYSMGLTNPINFVSRALVEVKMKEISFVC